MKIMRNMSDNSVDLTLTDIPYGKVNRNDNGLRNLDKGNADIESFDLIDFCKEVHRISKGTVIIFCGKEQLSSIYEYFSKQAGTTRQIIWQKSNPSPMNGQYVYLSGVENAVWFKKPGGVFNAHCRNTVFKYPNGSSKLHPTQKNIDLIRQLVLENSNKYDKVFDPCFGSCTTGVACLETDRDFIGIEKDEFYYNLGKNRLSVATSELYE
jgi:DNA modification methylase